LFLREILIEFTNVEGIEADDHFSNVAEVIKYGVIVVSILPMIVVYPFLQRFFVQGVMIGSLKG
jgi:putative aldouronate transport system permease protein